LAAEAVGFFGGGGRGADGNVVGIGLLDGDAGELGMVLLDDFLKVSKGLDFVQQWSVNAGNFKIWTISAFLLLPRVTVSNEGLLTDMMARAAVGRGITVGGRGYKADQCHVT
jgi:hypothetical protein